MRFELVPTLDKLREVYLVPRGPERFQAYLAATAGGAQRAEEVNLPPLVLANPMAKKNVLAFVEDWLALKAEDVARQVLNDANARFEAIPFPRSIKVGLAVLDDLGGGWTNRAINDAARFEVGRTLQHIGWLTVHLWVSEVPSLPALRLSVLEATHRAAYAVQHGDSLMLAARMRQEGWVAARAGRAPTFDADELAYSRAVIASHLSSTHQPTVIACLYGDEAARQWGYAPLGLSAHAGFEVALANELECHKYL